jgi:shikimate kinase
VHDSRNIVLIGMPGAGKSTVGVLLAKATSRDFIDTDLVIQAREGMHLQALLETRGIERFRHREESHVLAIAVRRHVIATGGSVVYSRRAMDHLRASGVTVFLSLPLPSLEKRLKDIAARGVVMASGQSLEELYGERRPLYERYADITVDCSAKRHEEVVRAVLEALP